MGVPPHNWVGEHHLEATKARQAIQERQASMAAPGKGLLLIVLLGLVSPALSGFRCSLGEFACTASCDTLGQTSGLCTDEGECQCSERSISLDNLKALLPSRCHLGASFCTATCNSIGRKDGNCVTKESGETDCQCGGYLSPKEFALCAAESTCRLDCQRQGFASGDCFGWYCKCKSNKESSIPAEFEDIATNEE